MDRPIYLSHYHIFGRMQYSVNTVIEGPEISRYHAVIEWRMGQWELKDLSTNGVWINNIKVQKNVNIPLTLGDEICFGHPQSNVLVFAESQPPEDMLYRYDTTDIDAIDQEAITLMPYHLLPNKEAPQMVLYKDMESWWGEDILDSSISKRCLKNGDLVSINGVRWQLRTAMSNEQTLCIQDSQVNLKELLADFTVSQDEETIQLTVTKGVEPVDLKFRNYHYLSLYLARRRVLDVLNGFTASEQGWVYVDEIARDLGIEESTVNLHVHRARKQFVHSVEAVNNAPEFIERRPLQLRFGDLKCRITKADKIESESPPFMNSLTSGQ